MNVPIPLLYKFRSLVSCHDLERAKRINSKKLFWFSSLWDQNDSMEAIYMVSDPAGYRWSSYGEAVGCGNKGNGKMAREGLVRACMSHEGAGFEAEKWKEVSRIYRRAMGLALGRKSGKAAVDKEKIKPGLNTEEALAAKDNGTVLPDLGMAAMVLHRVRYFTDGAVIGSKAFVTEAFAAARARFGPRRKDGVRKLRGGGAPAAGVLWSVWDLRVGV